MVRDRAERATLTRDEAERAARVRNDADTAVFLDRPPLDLAVPTKLQTADFAFG